MRAALLAALLIVAACGSNPSAAVVSPSPSPSATVATPSASPSATPSPSPSASSKPSGTAVALAFGVKCVLPITWSPTNAGANASNSGTGFWDARTGAITSKARLPTPHFLTGGPSFDAELGKWLPVPSSAIAPDGLHFAYAEWDPPAAGMSGSVHAAAAPLIGSKGRVHMVDARTGVDQILYSGDGTYEVVGYVTQGILLESFTPTNSTTLFTGLYLEDPTDLAPGGIPQPVQGGNYPLDSGGWRVIDGDTAGWGTSFTGVVSHFGGGNRLNRFDFSTLAVASWLTAPDAVSLSVLGVMDHNPVVMEADSNGVTDTSPAKLVMLTAANQPRTLFTTGDPNSLPNAGGAIQDGHGFWIGGFGTLWLYDGKSMRHVPVLDQNTIVDVGGPCQAA